uniref:Transmembrane actin-binding protein n=3 Tax=Zygosaccharomyces rouxii TaxID=4956 RepID=A0A1V1FFP1_ZYGRO|nr:transmembrane actin-binding protein [Zygosaccharomyces rouxii]
MPSIDLSKSIRKACSIEETAPKRKHVRACIVYTWDHHSAAEFFIQLKGFPMQDDVQEFKCLILLHKVIQEGHGSVLKEAIRNREWVRSIGRMRRGSGGYSSLIGEYVHYLTLKLDFHAHHKGFQSGTFEYKEYVSLMHVSNPDEGYETILDLMDLQDSLDKFQMVVMASIGRSRASECRISALVPLVGESYGIYKFITSMIRALYGQLGDTEALDAILARHDSQHDRLFEFYADCSSIKYLTSLITLPKLPSEPPKFNVERSPTPSSPVEPKPVSFSRKSSAVSNLAVPNARSRSYSRDSLLTSSRYGTPPVQPAASPLSRQGHASVSSRDLNSTSVLTPNDTHIPNFMDMSSSTGMSNVNLMSEEPRPIISSDVRLAIYLSRQCISNYNQPVSVLSISQLCNEVASQFLSNTPHVPTIMQLTHQITTLLQHNPSPLLAQASQLYFQALLSPSQQDIINANTNLQQLLTN